MSTSPWCLQSLNESTKGEKEILVQTRWKPDRDPLYSGTLEIPAGGMHVYENVYDAVKREVLEETGLTSDELLS
jgi:8-oxo-dGTP pyrophosphatase MutT (NUDIX family)